MTIWRKAVAKIREEFEHRERRLNRIEQLAVGGKKAKPRVDFTHFAEDRSHAQGLAEGLGQALSILNEEIDEQVQQLAGEGLDATAIATRLGVSIKDIADSFCRREFAERQYLGGTDFGGGPDDGLPEPEPDEPEDDGDDDEEYDVEDDDGPEDEGGGGHALAS